MSSQTGFWRAISPDSAWMNSTANEELVKGFPTPQDAPMFHTISFTCKSPCTVLINKGKGTEETITVNPDYGLERDGRFRPIYSFIIVEPDIEYYFLAGY